MNAVTTTAIGPGAGTADALTAQRWLDALVRGECSEDEFVQAVAERCTSAPDAAWEVLSQLDQYHRRRKLAPALFNSLKSRIERHVFGLKGEEAARAADAILTRPIGPLRAEPGMGSDVDLDADPQREPPMTAAELVARVSVPRTAAAGAASIRPGSVPPATAGGAAGTGTGADAGVGASASASASAARIPRIPQIGDLLRGRYRLDALLGRGGMGTVFEALDRYRAELPAAGQRLAIKVLHTQVSDRPDLFAELRREFQHSQALSHPNIVRVHEFDRDGDLAFFTMELLHGTLLSQLQRQLQPQRLEHAHALAVIRDVGAALAHAHSRDVVHGDLKPQNIFITTDGGVRVLDFGAAHTLIREPWISEASSVRRNAVATPGYASCQMLECQHPDARDDVYAFACVAYELLSGEHPFERRSALEARRLRLRPRCPAGLRRGQWQALRAGLAWERERRPGDVNEWLERFGLERAVPQLPALPALLSRPPPTHRRATLWVTLVIAAAAIVAAWFAGTSGWIDVGSLQRQTQDAVGRGVQWWTGVTRSWRGAAPAVPVVPAASVGNPGDAGVASADDEPAAAPAVRAGAGGGAGTRTDRRAGADVASAGIPGGIAAAAAAAAGAGAGGSASASAGASADADAEVARLGLSASTFTVTAGQAAAHITVVRAGPLDRAVSFQWWTEPASAHAGRDFVSWGRRQETVPAGQASTTLLVPIVSDPARRRSTRFDVVIGAPGSDAALGAITRATVIIPPAGDG